MPLAFVNSDEGSESAVAIKVAERKCVPQVKKLHAQKLINNDEVSWRQIRGMFGTSLSDCSVEVCAISSVSDMLFPDFKSQIFSTSCIEVVVRDKSNSLHVTSMFVHKLNYFLLVIQVPNSDSLVGTSRNQFRIFK